MPDFYYEPWFAALGYLIGNIGGLVALFYFLLAIGYRQPKVMQDLAGWYSIVPFMGILAIASSLFITKQLYLAQLIAPPMTKAIGYFTVIGLLVFYASVGAAGFIIGRRRKRNTPSS